MINNIVVPSIIKWVVKLFKLIDNLLLINRARKFVP